MIIVYAIISEVRNWLYIGQTNNLERRLHEHNSGLNKSTKPYKPFQLIYQESFIDRNKARIAEKYYKSAAGKRKLNLLLKNHGPV